MRNQTADIHMHDVILPENEPIRWVVKTHTRTNFRRCDMHYPLEMGILLTGRVWRYWGNWRKQLGPGDVWLCGIWELHGYSIEIGPSRSVVFFALPEALLRLNDPQVSDFDWLAPFAAPPGKRPTPTREARRKIMALARRAGRPPEFRGNLMPLWGKSLFMQILLLLCGNWTTPGKQRLVGKVDAYSRLRAAIDLALRGHEHISATQAAAACGMNPTQFNGAFPALMGLSFAQFALRQRLNGAKLALQQTPAPVKTIAGNWGFRDTSHFCRCFKHHYGLTPAGYRQGEI